MRKIIIELEIDWEGYDDVADELIVQDAIQARVDGVGWKLLRQPPVISSVCDCEPHTFYEWEKDENKCTQCSKPIYEQTDL